MCIDDIWIFFCEINVRNSFFLFNHAHIRSRKKRKHLSNETKFSCAYIGPLCIQTGSYSHCASCMEIEPFKSYTKATTAGRVDQLWTKRNCSSHPLPLLGKVKTADQGCGFRASSGGSFEKQLKPWFMIYDLIYQVYWIIQVIVTKYITIQAALYVRHALFNWFGQRSFKTDFAELRLSTHSVSQY